MRSKQYDILVVDDDAEDRMMMGEAFTEQNCRDRVTMYPSSESFQRDLTELQDLSPLPYLIVLDYQLPGDNGASVLDSLQANPRLRAIPVVMYSTGMNQHQQQDCLTRGALHCFEKGVTYREVVAFCAQLCKVAYPQQAFKWNG